MMMRLSRLLNFRRRWRQACFSSSVVRKAVTLKLHKYQPRPSYLEERVVIRLGGSVTLNLMR